MRMNTERVPKSCNANADPASTRKAAIAQEEGEASTARVCRGFGDGMFAEGVLWQHGKSRAVERRTEDEPEARDGKTGLAGWRRGPYYPGSRVTPVGGNGPWFKGGAGTSKGRTGYRFYSLYDKDPSQRRALTRVESLPCKWWCRRFAF